MMNTFVFLDLESTGLPMNGIRVRASEVSLISVSRKNILTCVAKDCIPRIINKISFVVNPRSMIPDDVVELTNLSNENLEEEPPFDQNKADLIKLFLQSCAPPICLIAHNGFKFDFPLLKKELAVFDQIVLPDLWCADSLPGFKSINRDPKDTTLSPIIDRTDVMLFKEVSRIEERISRQESNETTPIAQLITEPGCFNDADGPPKSIPRIGSVKRQLFADNDRGEQSWTKLRLNYSLKHIYYSLFNQPIAKAHRAENDAIALLQCCVKIGLPLLEYFDCEAKKFEDIIAMR